MSSNYYQNSLSFNNSIYLWFCLAPKVFNLPNMVVWSGEIVLNGMFRFWDGPRDMIWVEHNKWHREPGYFLVVSTSCGIIVSTNKLAGRLYLWGLVDHLVYIARVYQGIYQSMSVRPYSHIKRLLYLLLIIIWHVWYYCWYHMLAIFSFWV